MTPVKCLCVKQPHLTSWVFRSDELLILFLLLPFYQSNELLILSSFAHFLLWLCMPLLHFLNTLVYIAFGRAQAHPSSPVQPCPSVPEQLLVCPHGGYLTEKLGVRNTGYSIDLFSAMERALQRMWFSLPAPTACWHCCPLLPSTRREAPNLPCPYNRPSQKDPPCFLRGFAQPSCRGKTALSPCLVCLSTVVFITLCNYILTDFSHSLKTPNYEHNSFQTDEENT